MTSLSADPLLIRAAFIGSAGIPNRYGGFEAFLEHCAPLIARRVQSVTVTCDRSLYEDRRPDYQGVQRRFVPVRANGASSTLHDLLAFRSVFAHSSHIVVLGVSGGPWFALWRLLCSLTGKKLLVNVDGVEWRRAKFSPLRRCILRLFDALAQRFAHTIIVDNHALIPYLLPSCRPKACRIGYSGDHVARDMTVGRQPGTALTICRIEPENNIEMTIEGALASRLVLYTVVGNWGQSEYGRSLRARYAGHARLRLLDSIYDPEKLVELREGCEGYIHGHSVGGTNPSLVEMLFYDARLYCFDCPFHHETVGDCAIYFSDAKDLSRLLDDPPPVMNDRTAVRRRFTGARIADQYVEAMLRGDNPLTPANSTGPQSGLRL